ncbi:MAG: hypothetical protein LC118_00155 [Dehalococcoidia bacterium]|nr:hypothetical protein [Dehalococcoidia bacterium]
MNHETIERLERLAAQETIQAERLDGGAGFNGRVAVLPSAFNPPTLAHLHLLERARSLEEMTDAAAMLSTRNVDKGISGAALWDRVGMLLAAREEHGWLGVLAVNAARLVDQGEALREAFPGVRFDFVVGFDTLLRLFDRKYYSEMERELEPFFAEHRVIATNRAEDRIDVVEAFIEHGAGAFAARIVALEIDEGAAAMSSTAARRALEAGSDAPHLPRGVQEYITRRRLYRTSGES